MLRPKQNLNIFYTAGYPKLNSTVEIAIALEKAGADLIELGIPFSDPMADGPLIQFSSEMALKNGMTLDLLFDQVKVIKTQVKIPLILMGYLNPIFQYGIEKFLEKCKHLGIDGLIIPDLSLETYEGEYSHLFEKYQVPLTFLITPTTSIQRIQKIETLTKSFIYLVSSSSITGNQNDFTSNQIKGFERIANLKIQSPILVGFGIHNHQTFSQVCQYFDGAIIGSAFIKHLKNKLPIHDFINNIRMD